MCGTPMVVRRISALYLALSPSLPPKQPASRPMAVTSNRPRPACERCNATNFSCVICDPSHRRGPVAQAMLSKSKRLRSW